MEIVRRLFRCLFSGLGIFRDCSSSSFRHFVGLCRLTRERFGLREQSVALERMKMFIKPFQYLVLWAHSW